MGPMMRSKSGFPGSSTRQNTLFEAKELPCTRSMQFKKNGEDCD